MEKNSKNTLRKVDYLFLKLCYRNNKNNWSVICKVQFSKTKIDLPRALKQFVLHEFFVSHNINSSHDIEYRPIRFLWICSSMNIHVFRNFIS